MKKSVCIATLFGLLMGTALPCISYATPIQLYVNAPYKVNPIQHDAHIPPLPTPSSGAFDCTTYVETLLAQQKQRVTGHSFEESLLTLRYMDGKIGFFSRAHLMEYHWIPNAIKQQFIREYPLENTQKSTLSLNLQEWFLKNAAVKEKDAAYTYEARQQPQQIKASIPYIPVEHITEAFLQELPSPMVVFFLRKIAANSWAGQTEEQILVTHMGMLLQERLYHASIKTKQVSVTDLLHYLQTTPKCLGVSFYEVTMPLLTQGEQGHSNTRTEHK